jgi:glutathione S-transferase
MSRPVVYHIPVCPFSQRVEILLALKGIRDEVDFHVVDITRARPDWLLEKTRGTSALPILELAGGRIVKESLVILQYFEHAYPKRRIAQSDPYRRAVEGMLTRLETEFTALGYEWVMSQDLGRRGSLEAAMLKQYERLDAFLLEHAPNGPFLFDDLGWAEAVFTPLFMRFWFLEYYEDFTVPDDERYARVRRWIDACLAHPAAQQVTKEQVVKLYYDYAKGAGNGALLPGRRASSFAFEPHWRTRPWPPKNKYDHGATDEELGLRPP